MINNFDIKTNSENIADTIDVSEIYQCNRRYSFPHMREDLVVAIESQVAII